MEPDSSGSPLISFSSRPLFGAWGISAPSAILPAGALGRVMPAEDSKGDFLGHLPAVTFSDAGFPLIAKDGANYLWMAILLFSDTDLENGLLQSSILSENQLPSYLVPLVGKDQALNPLNIISVDRDFLRDQLPDVSVLGSLYHVRKVGFVSESVLMGTRVPAGFGSFTAHLVSIAGALKEDGTFASAAQDISLASLYSWSFQVEEEGVELSAGITNYFKDTIGPPVLLSPSEKEALPKGDLPPIPANAVYRPPLGPKIEPVPLSLPALNAEGLVLHTDDEEVDGTYAVAWWKGRQYAMQDRVMAHEIDRWRSQFADGASGSEAKPGADLTHKLQYLAEFRGVSAEFILPSPSGGAKDTIQYAWIDSSWRLALLDGAFSAGRLVNDLETDKNHPPYQMDDPIFAGQFAIILQGGAVGDWPDLAFKGHGSSGNWLSPLFQYEIETNTLLVVFPEELKVVQVYRSHAGLVPVLQKDGKGGYQISKDGASVPVKFKDHLPEGIVDWEDLFGKVGPDPGQLGVSLTSPPGETVSVSLEDDSQYKSIRPGKENFHLEKGGSFLGEEIFPETPPENPKATPTENDSPTESDAGSSSESGNPKDENDNPMDEDHQNKPGDGPAGKPKPEPRPKPRPGRWPWRPARGPKDEKIEELEHDIESLLGRMKPAEKSRWQLVVVVLIIVAAIFVWEEYLRPKPSPDLVTHFEGIRSTNEIRFVHQVYREIIPFTNEKKNEKLEFLLDTHGSIYGMIDPSDIGYEIDAEKKIVHVKLPPPILSDPVISIDSAQEKMVRGATIFDKLDESGRKFSKVFNNITVELAKTKDAIVQNAIKNGIYNEVDNQARQYVIHITSSFGYQVNFIENGNPDSFWNKVKGELKSLTGGGSSEGDSTKAGNSGVGGDVKKAREVGALGRLFGRGRNGGGS